MSCTNIIQITKTVDVITTEYKYIEGQVVTEAKNVNNSWTMSYSLENQSWVSWHSYLPNFYINVPDKFYSWIYGNNNIWKHNKLGHYQIFYGVLYPYIIEYVSNSNPITTRIFDYISMITDVKLYNFDMEEFLDINDVFFNKLIAYNSRQCSGELNIKVKDADKASNYLWEQVENILPNEIIVDRNERNWTLNTLRDIRTKYNEPIFISKLSQLQNKYYIDKVLNTNSLDFSKDWTQLESFRDKYLVVRFIFDNFAEVTKQESGQVKIINNFSMENETHSFR